MAAIEITSSNSGGSTPLATGILQIQNGVAIDTTLRNVTDQNGNVSALSLSTNSINSTGSGNVLTNSAFGNSALFSNTTGANNCAFGFSALYFNLTGNQNTAYGINSLTGNTTGGSNTAMGWQSLLFNQTGNENVAIGNRANYGTTGQSCARNIAIGSLSLLFNYGDNNVAIGYQSLRNNTTATNNTAVGHNTASGNFSGSVILGNGATATADNQFVVGSLGTNAGTVTAEVNLSANVWNVVINGVARKILLA